jgi:hypothetical protein
VGQKIGIVVYRDFVVTAEDVGMPKNTLSNDYLRGIYENRVNIYTGQTTRFSPNGNAFEYDTNTFAGCSGAVILLLDGQDENSNIVSEPWQGHRCSCRRKDYCRRPNQQRSVQNPITAEDSRKIEHNKATAIYRAILRTPQQMDAKQ